MKYQKKLEKNLIKQNSFCQPLVSRGEEEKLNDFLKIWERNLKVGKYSEEEKFRYILSY
jgi:hypothetical protein